MPDISMCDGHNCDKKDACYRYTATPSPFWQSYMQVKDPKNCLHFWEVRSKSEIKRLDIQHDF